MSAFSTSCPNCGAAFIVTPQQLAVANGSVRCGSCMHIFLAAQHHTDVPPPPDDNIFDFKLGGDEVADNSGKIAIKPVTEGEFSDQFLNLNNEHQVFADADSDDSKASDDEQWAKKLLADLEDDNERRPVRGKVAETEKMVLSEEFAGLESAQRTARTQPAPASQADTDALAGLAELSLKAEPDNERKRMLFNIQAEPLEFTFRRVHWSQLLARTLYTLACLVAVLGMAAQYTYFKFDELARDDRYRPWYQLACEKLQCTLPDRNDIAQIQATNLVVRSHPKIADALIVDALLTNRAAYEQPFPELELIFTNMQGQIVAARRLKPQEYFQAAGTVQTMPSHEPIHLALEIVDPGPAATGYRIVIHPAGRV